MYTWLAVLRLFVFAQRPPIVPPLMIETRDGWPYRLADRLGVLWDHASRDQVLIFFRLLLEWNRRINLTGAKSIAELEDEHLIDSVALAYLIPAGARVVDVGSGGGLPAIPFSIVRPDCNVTLVEPRAKRVAFLHTAARVLGGSRLKVVNGRDEDLLACTFDVAVSRATYPPKEWLEQGRRLVVAGGEVIVLSPARPSLDEAGVRVVKEVEYSTRQGVPRWAGSYCST
jgi:16S rRNA (guanine527-N7)-methyltransferase